MSAEEALSKLYRFIDTRNRDVLVVLAGKTTARLEEGVDAAARFTIQRLNLHVGVANDFRAIAHAFVASKDQVRLRRYDPGYKPDSDEILWLRLEDFQELLAVDELIASLNAAPLFDAADESIERLRYYVLIVGAGKTTAHFYRSFTPRKELSRSGLFALLQQRGTYNKITDKVLLFDQKIDCVAWDGYLFIDRLGSVQAMFGFYEALQRKAKRVAQQILAQIPISNSDEFKEACESDVRFAAKLASIASKSYLNHVSVADLERTIADFNLPVRLEGPSGRKAIVFDAGVKTRWLILKMLDDDYLGSTMTRERYEVNSKISIG